jgi:hypothetical protein
MKNNESIDSHDNKIKKSNNFHNAKSNFKTSLIQSVQSSNTPCDIVDYFKAIRNS